MIAANPLPHVVLIDTCIWVPFFNRKPSIEKNALSELARENRAALIGPVLTEILRGFRRNEEADWAASKLTGVQFIDLEWSHWRTAARIARLLAARDHDLPLTDLVLSAVALEDDCAIYSTDPHFDSVPNLKRFYPK